MITPDDIEEYLGAYALDAVEPEERLVIEQYLATHPRARAEVAEHQEVATLLAFTGGRAPDRLWDRISDAVEDQAPEPGPELAKLMPLSAAQRRRDLRTGLFAIVGAAAAAIIVALGLVVLDQRDRLDDSEIALEAVFEKALDESGSRPVTLLVTDTSVTVPGVVTADGDGYVRADDLPALGPDETYQLWAFLPDRPEPISLGVLGPAPTIAAFHTDVDQATLAISAEQRGGAAAPTEVVATGALG